MRECRELHRTYVFTQVCFCMSSQFIPLRPVQGAAKNKLGNSFSSLCTADSQTNLGQNQLHNNVETRLACSPCHSSALPVSCPLMGAVGCGDFNFVEWCFRDREGGKGRRDIKAVCQPLPVFSPVEPGYLADDVKFLHDGRETCDQS